MVNVRALHLELELIAKNVLNNPRMAEDVPALHSNYHGISTFKLRPHD